MRNTLDLAEYKYIGQEEYTYTICFYQQILGNKTSHFKVLTNITKQ